jgi:molybdate transport system ATP-binding protein
VNPSAIKIDFHKSYPGFNLNIKTDFIDHCITAIYGPSGCGKTTLLRLIAGLERCENGYLNVMGELWQDSNYFRPTHQRDVGIVFQNAWLFEHLNVKQNLEYGRKRVPKHQKLKSMDHIIALFGIEHLLNRRPNRLSGGEQQRIALARALAVNPRILLLDEPLAALDLERKKEILPYLQSIHKEWNIPMLYVTHSPDEVAQLADYLCVLQEGRCLANDKIQTVLSQVHLPIAMGEEACSVFEVTLVEHNERHHLMALSLENHRIWMRRFDLAVGSKIRIRILARDVSLSKTKPEDSSILNHLQCRVESINQGTHPAQALVLLRINDQPLLARVTYQSIEFLGIIPNMIIWAQIKTMGIIG